MINTDQIQNYFKENKYVVIKNFLDENSVGLIYRYCITRVMAMDYKYFHDEKAYKKDWDGEWEDPQAYGCYSAYGDALMDSVLLASTKNIASYTGLDLLPNYSYWRMYQHKSILEKHQDRNSCEISATICLGYDISNLTEEDKDYVWPIFVKSTDGYDLQIDLSPGDMLIYRGCDLEHWRDPFKGLSQAQVFVHYNEKKSDDQSCLDGRPIIGIPKKLSIRSKYE